MPMTNTVKPVQTIKRDHRRDPDFHARPAANDSDTGRTIGLRNVRTLRLAQARHTIQTQQAERVSWCTN